MLITIIGYLFLIVGVFYIFGPHSIHNIFLAGLGLSHIAHIILGIVITVLGLLILSFEEKNKLKK